MFMMALMKYLCCDIQDQVSILDMEIPRAGPGEVVARLVMCGICGTDTAKVFGAYAKPQQLGHEVVGVVHEVGDGVSRFAVGQRIAFAHHVPDYSTHYSRRGSETMDATFKRSNIRPGGFSEYILVPAPHVDHVVVAVPHNVPDERAVFMEPMACCLRALDRVSFTEGDSCLVVGVGAVGLLFVPLLRDAGVTVVAADVRAERIALAKQWGAAAGGSVGTDDIAAISRDQSGGRGVDVVILTVVNEATLALAFASLRDGGTLLLFGGKPGFVAPLAWWDIWVKEINVVTSYSATPSGLHRAMAILAGQGYIGLEGLISHRMPLANSQNAFRMVHEGRASKLVLMP
jgi:L-iditol 2-dehydrogenase